MKKFLSLIISMSMIFTLAACGTSGSVGGTLADENSGDFPNETITMVCPFSAGGGTDVGARYMAASLSKLRRSLKGNGRQ